MEIVNTVLEFAQNGISFIFGLIAKVINWTVGQVQAFTNLPWGTMSWPKLATAVSALVASGYLLWYGGKTLYVAALDLFAAFGAFVAALIRTIPWIAAAGVVIAIAIWIIRTFRF